jgi:hypothetical protein
MKFNKFIIFYLITISIIACKVDEKEAGYKNVEQLLTSYYQTMSDRNWVAYKSFFWQDATLCTIWSPDTDQTEKVDVFTIDEFLSKTSEGPDSQPVFEESIIETKIKIEQNLATAWVKYKAKFGTKDDLLEWTGTDLFSLMEYNNQWKIVNLSYAAD